MAVLRPAEEWRGRGVCVRSRTQPRQSGGRRGFWGCSTPDEAVQLLYLCLSSAIGVEIVVCKVCTQTTNMVCQRLLLWTINLQVVYYKVKKRK